LKVPESVIEEISSRADIVSIVGEYVQLTRKGNRFWGLCPFHTEKSPSFTVSPEREGFYCFGCQKGGSVFTFLMEMEKVSFPEAVQMLGRKTGVSVELGQGTVDDEATRKKDALRELYRRVAGSFSYLLTESDQAAHSVSYLTRRALTRETIAAFGLGYAPADPFWLHRFLRTKGYSPEFLLETGLFTRKSPERSLFVDRIIFPIRDRAGDVVAFGGRSLADNGPKYLNSPDSAIFHKGEQLYGIDLALANIRHDGSFVLVEGYMDVIALHQSGVSTAIAPLGTAFTEGQARLLHRYASTGYLLFDNDDAGAKAAERSSIVGEHQGLDFQVIQLPGGKDPSEILEKQGPEPLKHFSKYTISILDYLITRALKRNDVGTPRGKEVVLNEVFSYISSIASDTKREDSLGILADALGVDRQAVFGDFRRRRGGGASEPGHAVRATTDTRITADLFLMMATVVNRGHFALVRRTLKPEDLTDLRARALFVALEECYRRGEASLQMLLERIDDESLRALVLEKTNSDEFNLNQEKSINDGVYHIKKRILETQRADVESRIRQYGRKSGGDVVAQLLELQQEKMYLDAELEKLKVKIHDRAAE
jgi:DNA primase